MKTRKFCRNNSKLQLLWELRERQLEGILGPVRGNLRETGIKANKMAPTVSTNVHNDPIINKNVSDNNVESQEDPTTATNANHNSNNNNNNNNAVDNVNNPQLNLLSRAVDARRSYELDKIRRHKMEAAEDIERYKKEKLQRLQAKEEEKRRDLQMLTNYYPWGRSLGNFERTNYRKQKWNRPGDWSAELGSQPQEYTAPSQNNMSPTLRWPLDLKHQNIDEGFQREILQPEKEKLVLNEPIENFDTDIQFSMMKDQNLGQENTLNMEQAISDQKVIDSSSNGHKRKYVSSDPNPKYTGIISPRMKRSPSPSEVMRARAARVYMEELKKGMAEQKKKKEEMEKEVRAPIGELATVMGKGRVGRPRRDPLTGILLDNHLKTSDVSKEKIGKILEENASEKVKYGHDLIHAAEERYRLKELEKLKVKQQEIQHQETYNDIWGRPGGGAPRDPKLGNRMAKLNNMLYKDLLALNSNNTGKSSTEIQEQRISPSVRCSTHQNQYDYPNHVKEFKDYNFRTPWANFY